MLDRGYWIPPLDLPAIIASGLKQSHHTSRHMAIIGTCMYLGADLLDDLHDQELSVSERAVSVSDLTLLSAILLTVFPVLLIAELEMDTETKLTMQATLARSLLKMAAGQQRDLFAQKNISSLKEIKESVEAKSGEELALACLLAAQTAKVSPSQQKSWEDFGRSLGTAVQLASDVHDLMWSSAMGQSKQRAHLLPVAFCLKNLEGDYRKILIDSGSLDYTALVIEEYSQRALEILESLELPREIKGPLQEKIHSVSLLPVELKTLHPDQGGTYENTVTSY